MSLAENQTKGLTPTDPASLPDMLASMGKQQASKYRVRWIKLNLDDLADISELERIETKALRDEGVYVVSKKDFFFMDKIFMLVSYWEVDDSSGAV